MAKRILGIAVVGLGGAVGTTMAAGVELLKKGLIGVEGLPLAGVNIEGLADYTDIVFSGWDVNGANLAAAAEEHDVLTYKQFVAAEPALRTLKPWSAASDSAFLSNIEGENTIGRSGHRATIEKIRSDLSTFKAKCDSVVVINLASTEKLTAEGNEIFNSIEGFEKALDENSPHISPAMFYAYASI
ncbi:MAG TPA: inositol-3-phosphate synthase, partial [Pyrinomonadaceae bacterium]|nr:inositol-3-phosphate synthase [Pyrinomonadaceae bacterium]